MVFSIFDLSILFLFFFFYLFLFLGTAWYETEILKEPINKKQQTLKPFSGINFKVAKSVGILQYTGTKKLFCLETKQQKFCFLVLFW